MRHIILLSACIIAMVFASSAHAVRIRNTDATPHQLTLITMGDTRTLTLEPNASFTRLTPGLDVQLQGGKVISTRPDESYIITEGTLQLYRRNCCGLGNE